MIYRIFNSFGYEMGRVTTNHVCCVCGAPANKLDESVCSDALCGANALPEYDPVASYAADVNADYQELKRINYTARA